MNTFALVAAFFVVFVLYVVPLLVSAAYYFSVVTLYQGLSLGRLIRSLLLIVLPMVNLFVAIVLMIEISNDVERNPSLSLRKVLQLAGKRPFSEISLERNRYYAQQNPLIRNIYRIIHWIFALVSGLFDMKLITKGLKNRILGLTT